MRVDLHLGRATGAGLDTLTNIEGVIAGDGKDVLLGSRGPDTLLAWKKP